MVVWWAYSAVFTATLVLALRIPTPRSFRRHLLLRESSVEERAEVIDQRVVEPSKWRFIAFLRQYERNFQSRNVPQDFVVPATTDWSAGLQGKSYSELWYMALQEKGFYSELNRGRLKTFNISLPWHYETHIFNTTVLALEAYSHEYCDLLVPQTFRVPMKSPWPQQCWNLPLGQLVFRIRNRGAFLKASSHRRQILDDMGFIWNVTEFKHQQFQDAIRLYFQWNGHLDTPKTFVFPDLEVIPRHLRNYRFGDVLDRFNKGLVFKGARFDGLYSNASIGLSQSHVKRVRSSRSLRRYGACPWNALRNATLFEDLFSALVCFKECHGHLFIPPYYVPSLSE